MSRLSYDPTHCTLCPRRCGGDRTRAKGYCRMPDRPVVARAALHFWEDPPLSGTPPARAANQARVRQTGPYDLDQEGILQRGVVIRHLLLPGRLNQAKEVMDWVRATFPPHTVLFSLMSQYIPWGRAAEFPPLDRRLRKREARAAMAYLENLSLDGFFQGEEAARAEYIPAFDLSLIHI